MMTFRPHSPSLLRAGAALVVVAGLVGCSLDPPLPTKVEPRIDRATAKVVAGGVSGIPIAAAPAPKGALQKAPIPAITEPDAFGPAYIADSRNGLLSFDGSAFKLVHAVQGISALAPNASGRVLLAARDAVYVFDSGTSTATKLPNGPWGVRELAAQANNNIFVVGRATLGRFSNGVYERLTTLPDHLPSPRSIFVDTAGDVWVGDVLSASRYSVSNKRWTEVLTSSGKKLSNFVVLPNGRVWGRVWLRGFRYGYLLGPDKVWKDTGKSKGAALWVAAGSRDTVHLADASYTRVVDVTSMKAKRWEAKRDYTVQVLDMDADGSGRTWLVGTGGLAILPALGATDSVRSFTTQKVRQSAGLRQLPSLGTVYVRGKGPATVASP